MAKKPDTDGELIAENRKARHDYHIGETLEVGIILHGSEVKAVRDHKVSLTEGWVLARAHPPELLLMSVNIGEFGPAGALGHKPVRPRGLLAHKSEVRRLAKAMEVKGATIVPLKMYFKNGYAKVLIGVAKGKAEHDKRDAIAKRDAKRDMDRAMSRRR
ncbi:MAG: SsrA-binding protein [Phycisphaerae bacterium]|nr:MAG: SsrA-binding protein [Phycisphaerae bacterium]